MIPFDTDVYIFASRRAYQENLKDLTVGTGGSHYFNLEHYGNLEEAFDLVIGKPSFPWKPLLARVRLTECCVFLMKMKMKLEVCVAFTSHTKHTSETAIGTCIHGRPLLLSR